MFQDKREALPFGNFKHAGLWLSNWVTNNGGCHALTVNNLVKRKRPPKWAPCVTASKTIAAQADFAWARGQFDASKRLFAPAGVLQAKQGHQAGERDQAPLGECGDGNRVHALAVRRNNRVHDGSVGQSVTVIRPAVGE